MTANCIAPAAKSRMSGQLPVGFEMGEPEDVAPMASCLLGEKARPLSLHVGERRVPETRHLRRIEGDEVLRHGVRIELPQEPVQHGGEPGIVEGGLGAAWHAHQILAPPIHREEPADGLPQRRNAVRRARAVGQVTALTLEHVVDPGVGTGGSREPDCDAQRDGRGDASGRAARSRPTAPHDSVATPTTTATVEL